MDVVTQAVVEQHGVLRHNANRTAKAALRDVRNRLTINRDLSRIDVVKTEQQARERRFARTAFTDNGGGGVRCDHKADIMQNLTVVVVAEIHMLELDFALCHS